MALPFTALSLVHNNLTHLMSSNEDKFDFLDSNRIPYAVKFNPEIPNFFSVADENGFIKFFSSFPKLKPIKEFGAQKSCIYDLQWLNSHEIACGGGDQYVSIFDVNTCTRLALLKGHTESVKSIAQLPMNPFVLASGSRDGSVLIFDVRFNRSSDPADSSVSYIRAVNNIQKAHFVEDFCHNPVKTGRSNILKAKHNNQSQSPHSSLKRSSPVASVIFQNENLLLSAGATDGLIKVWDIRKIYSSSKKHADQTPLYILNNQANANPFIPATMGGKNNSKGYSNIILNNAGTRAYANCMNNNIYEYNLLTYNQSHTRVLNSYNVLKNNLVVQNSTVTATVAETDANGSGNKPGNRYHLNQSNYIKSSISQCDNFILTGSSDFNAYIYSTNMNVNCSQVRKHMPVIVLKGHTNEVTAVDWNPLDSNQLITCSDDNTIRVWNVRRDLDMLKANECNFCLAEKINEFNEDDQVNIQSKLKPFEDEQRDINFVSKLKNRKNFPFISGVYDDLIFSEYEYKNFIAHQKVKEMRTGCDNTNMAAAEFTNELEKELCMKWKSIDIGRGHSSTHSSSSNSPTSLAIKSIENDLLDKSKPNQKNHTDFQILQLDTPTSNMPVNILKESEQGSNLLSQPNSSDPTNEDKHNENVTKQWLFKRQASSSTLLTNSTATASTQDTRVKAAAKKKPLKHKLTSDTSSPQAKVLRTATSKIGTSTSKKRSAIDSIESLIGEGSSAGVNADPRTPVSKRRLVLSQNLVNSPCSPKTSMASANVDSPVRTLLHYFSPKPAQK